MPLPESKTYAEVVLTWRSVLVLTLPCGTPVRVRWVSGGRNGGGARLEVDAPRRVPIDRAEHVGRAGDGA